MIRNRSHLLTLSHPTVHPQVPDHAPRIESRLRASIRTPAVRLRFGGTFVSNGLYSTLCSSVNVVHIVVDVVIDLVAEHAGKLVSVPQIRQHPSRNVNVAPRHRERVGFRLI